MPGERKPEMPEGELSTKDRLMKAGFNESKIASFAHSWNQGHTDTTHYEGRGDFSRTPEGEIDYEAALKWVKEKNLLKE